jgi:hypothetical protein
MLDELNPLTGERAVLAQMARQLAATLDGMDPAMSARMAGQTRGQLLKVLDKLGAQRREEGPAGAAAQDTSSVRPRRQATRSGSRASKTSSTPKSCRGSSRSTARRVGLPVPGTLAYSKTHGRWTRGSGSRTRSNGGGTNRGSLASPGTIWRSCADRDRLPRECESWQRFGRRELWLGRASCRTRQNCGNPTFWKNQNDDVNQIATRAVNVRPPKTGSTHPGRRRICRVSIFATKAP